MNLSDTDIIEFQELYFKVYGHEIEKEEALKAASGLINLMNLLTQN